MVSARFSFAVALALLLAACLPGPTPSAAVPVTITVTTNTAAVPLSTSTPSPVTHTPVPSATSTQPPAATATLPAPSPTATQTPTTDQQPGAAIVIDHTSVALFDQLPDDAVAAAAQLHAMHRASSIGENITRGLDCLQGHFPGRSTRPNFCSDLFAPRYDRTNWSFLLRGNPGWIDKVQDFVQVTNAQGADFDVLSFGVDYADALDESAYPSIADPDRFQADYLAPLEALEAAHPDKVFVWWTMSLARLGFQKEQQFNEMLRAYALANNKVLFDLADIESHSPDGVKTFDENGREVLYPGYSDEARSGHLNREGRERVAKAYWVLMARLAGWEGAP